METRGQDVATAQTMDKLAALLEAQQEQATEDRRLLLPVIAGSDTPREHR